MVIILTVILVWFAGHLRPQDSNIVPIISTVHIFLSFKENLCESEFSENFSEKSDDFSKRLKIKEMTSGSIHEKAQLGNKMQ